MPVLLSARLFAICLLSLRLTFTMLADDYRIEFVAQPSEFPLDPEATGRNFTLQQINNRGEVLFAAHWRDRIGLFRSAIHAGSPGGVRKVVEGGDPVAEFPGFVLAAGGERFSNGNFPEAYFNAEGEVLFVASVVDPGPNATPPPFNKGFWKADSSGLKLLGAAPGFNPDFSFPFAVQGVEGTVGGRLQWGDFRGFRIADNGFGIFVGDVQDFRDFRLNPVVNSGLFQIDPSGGMRRIDPGGLATQTSLAQKNGALVLDAQISELNTNSNTFETNRTIIAYRDGIARKAYVEGDPLPDLPPLAEIVGTAEPYDLKIQVLASDGAGNFLMAASASAQNRIDTRPLGIWKWSTNRLVKVLRWEEEISTPGGSVRIHTPDASLGVRAKIGNDRAVFLASFTGLGNTTPTLGLFQENRTNFTLLATPGTVVPGANGNFILGADLGRRLVTVDFYANQSNDVLFAAGYRTNSNSALLQGMWAWRDGQLQSVLRAGQELRIGPGTNSLTRTVRNFGYSALLPIFNDLGMFAANVFFTDGTMAIVRASPEATELPCCESQNNFRRPGAELRALADPAACDLFTFAETAPGDWHSSAWIDGRGQLHCEPPGDAAPNSARVLIPALSEVSLDQRPAPIRSLDSGGFLTLRQRLTINNTATVTDLVVEGPSGGVTLSNGAQMIVDNTLWKEGTLAMSDGVIPASFASVDSFLAESGAIEALSGSPVFESLGLFRKIGSGEFAVRVPFSAVNSAGIPPTLTDIQGGTLILQNGGSVEGMHSFMVASSATLELSGDHQMRSPGVSFGSNGIVHLGTTDRPILLTSSTQGELVLFNIQGNSALFSRGELRGPGTFVNQGNFIWSGGTINHRPGGSFVNEGSFQIDRGIAKKLNGQFKHDAGTVSQLSDLDLSDDGLLLIRAPWYIPSACRLIGPNGQITLQGTNAELKVELRSAGLVEIESALLSENGTILVSGTTSDDEATLRIGTLRNVQGTRLRGGAWNIATGGLLETPNAEIGSLTSQTKVRYGGRGWPQFRPSRNEGTITVLTNLSLRTLINDGRVNIEQLGDLEIQQDLVQQGARLLSSGLVCDGARLTVRGDFINRSITVAENGAALRLDGQLINTSFGELFIGLTSPETPTRMTIRDSVINQGSLFVGEGSLQTESEFINDAGSPGARALVSLFNDARMIVGSRFVNRADVSLQDNSTLLLQGDLEITEGVQRQSRIGIGTQSELHVQGNLTLDGSSTLLLITNYGSVFVDGQLRNRFGRVRLDQGTLQVGEMFFTEQSKLLGSGVVQGDTIVYGATSPGTSPGTLAISGNYTQTNTSVLEIEIAGTATNQFDRLLVSQTASIGGILALNLLDGFRPGPGDTFIILEAGALTNQFANATNGQRISTFGGFGSFRVNYTPTNILLSAFEILSNPAPTTPARLEPPAILGHTLELKLTGAPGREYLLETSTNLAAWLPAHTNVTGFDGEVHIQLDTSTDPHRYFRARAPLAVSR